MESEHCTKPGYNEFFTSSNYKITTNQQIEWLIVRGELQCPANQMGHGRKIQPISQPMEKPTAKKANLSEVEVIAVVLYTGPMVC
jgi:hypothetical protein